MKSAGPRLRDALAGVEVREPAVPVMCNVTARPYEDEEQIRELLVEQLTSTVRWRECVQHMFEAGVDAWSDLGPGKVVGALAQRTVRKLSREVAAGV
jgi:[acyl-carrier-protein] S-malonyltransferase